MGVILALVGSMGLAFCQWLIYIWTPVEQTMGVVQKIFYMHVPLALWGFVSFFVVFAGSILWLVKKRIIFDCICGAAAELGVLFSGLSLITGMIWAKKSWGIWWTWDPRLTSTLIMWFIYSSYLILRKIEVSGQKRRSVCAVVGILAFLDVPLVFLSARIFRSIHPAVLFSRSGSLEPEMTLTLAICILFLGILWWSLLMVRTNQIRGEVRLNYLQITKVNGD